MAKVAQKYLAVDPWKVIEKGFHKKQSKVSESIFSLGNEYMGVRGYFEEGYTGESLLGAYFNGIFEYSDDIFQPFKGPITKTHFLINSLDWLFTRITIDNETLDLKTAKISGFRRELDLREGTLTRRFLWTTKAGKKLRLTFQRFISMADPYLGAQRITLEARNFDGVVKVTCGLNFETLHVMENRNMWPHVVTRPEDDYIGILGQTERSRHRVISGMRLDSETKLNIRPAERPQFIAAGCNPKLNEGEPVIIDRLVVNLTEKNPRRRDTSLWKQLGVEMKKRRDLTYDQALEQHRAYWDQVWSETNISIDGDEDTLQGLRFGIFQLHQTYHGVDPMLNVSAKGLTGETYWGHTWWDTETYCLPFYMFNNPQAARNLLGYRYHTLPQACVRAEQVDCHGARYPMGTIDGNEACPVWQHGDLEIHVPAAVGYGIWHYVQVTNDTDFLYSEGIEMLLQICRYYASRGQWSQQTNEFGFWFVMGPDEFHMGVNNNYYTNFMARKCFWWAIDTLKEMRQKAPEQLKDLVDRLELAPAEPKEWEEMAIHMRLPHDPDTGVLEQHDDYFNMPHLDCDSIPPEDFPLYENWAYFRIFRWDMIKQPDVLLLPFFFSHEYDDEDKEVNYDYYEPRCSHESSLSPGVHSILAAELGRHEEAYTYWGHAARLDLDNYNRNTHDGLHTTSMAASWLNVVYGFGGLRSDGEVLSFKPALPKAWNAFSFRLIYRDSLLEVTINSSHASFQVVRGPAIPIDVFGKRYTVETEALTVDLPKDRRG